MDVLDHDDPISRILVSWMHSIDSGHSFASNDKCKGINLSMLLLITDTYCRSMSLLKAFALLLLVSLATGQDAENTDSSSALTEPVPTRAPGPATTCGLCSAYITQGRINSSIGCTQPGCGYCTLSSVAACTDIGPDNSGVCQGSCTGSEPVSVSILFSHN